MKLGPDHFLGSWRIARVITDFRLNESGALEGGATFTQEGDWLKYHETGMLRFGGAAPIRAERSYLWTFSRAEVVVAYADGAPFHSFPRDGAAEATPHLCGEDMYHGRYLFAAFPDWQVTWKVVGPRKDYRSVTQYSRT